MARIWTATEAKGIYEALRAGVPAVDLVAEHGASRSAIIGVAHRYRHAHGLPRLLRPAGAPKGSPKKNKPKLAVPAAEAPVATPSPRPPVLARPVVRPAVIRAARSIDRTPLCTEVMSDGTACDREAVDGCTCLGHRYLRDRSARLRPPPRRVTSTTRLVEEIMQVLPAGARPNGGRCRGRLDGLTPMQMSAALVRGGEHLDRLAAMYNWERVDDEAFRQVRTG